MCACVRAQLLQSCSILCNPMDCSLSGSSGHGILQARILEWVAMPSRDLPHPGIEPASLMSPHWQVGFAPLMPPGSALTILHWWRGKVESWCGRISFLSLASFGRETAMAPHSSTLAWGIPWTEEPGGLQSMGSRRVGHDWATSLSFSLSCTGEGNGTHSSALAWRIPGMGEPGGLPSMESHRVRHDWCYLAAAAALVDQEVLLGLHTAWSYFWWAMEGGLLCSILSWEPTSSTLQSVVTVIHLTSHHFSLHRHPSPPTKDKS